jgi:hypothetical protein
MEPMQMQMQMHMLMVMRMRIGESIDLFRWNHQRQRGVDRDMASTWSESELAAVTGCGNHPNDAICGTKRTLITGHSVVDLLCSTLHNRPWQPYQWCIMPWIYFCFSVLLMCIRNEARQPLKSDCQCNQSISILFFPGTNKIFQFQLILCLQEEETRMTDGFV